LLILFCKNLFKFRFTPLLEKHNVLLCVPRLVPVDPCRQAAQNAPVRLTGKTINFGTMTAQKQNLLKATSVPKRTVPVFARGKEIMSSLDKAELRGLNLRVAQSFYACLQNPAPKSSPFRAPDEANIVIITGASMARAGNL
jgi:hypothetical protein